MQANTISNLTYHDQTMLKTMNKTEKINQGLLKDDDPITSETMTHDVGMTSFRKRNSFSDPFWRCHAKWPIKKKGKWISLL